LSDPEPRAAIVGIAGTELDADEEALFGRLPPLGVILFARNIRDPEQLRRLVATVRGRLGRANAPILIDQEGGRVQRLTAPHWHETPAAGRIGALYGAARETAIAAARTGARLISAELADVGINVNCAPVLDLTFPGAHGVIGDRAFGGDPALVGDLGNAFVEGLRDGGVIPVVKHMPGHGRAMVDSHAEMPVVATSLDDLLASDLAAFRRVLALGGDRVWAMTAHVLFTAIDPAHVATESAIVINRVIRGAVGFDGVLLSDDLAMAAIAGAPGARAARARAAGCDLALHCSGRAADNRQVLEAVGPVAAPTRRRLEASLAGLPNVGAAVDRARLKARLDGYLSAA
jgi:beta-N-acetylhexosaminidase